MGCGGHVMSVSALREVDFFSGTRRLPSVALRLEWAAPIRLRPNDNRRGRYAEALPFLTRLCDRPSRYWPDRDPQ